MKKVLFVLENLTDKCTANINIVLNFVNQLSDEYEVSALVGVDNVHPVSNKYQNVFKEIYTFDTTEFGEILQFVESNWAGTSPISKLGRIVRKPKMLAYMIDNKYFDASMTKYTCKKAVEKVCQECKFDVVVGVSAPYYILRSISEAKISCGKMAIQLDPFTNNYFLSNSLKKWREIIENKTVCNLDRILMADCAYDEMSTYLEEKNLEKVKPIALPGITKELQNACKCDDGKTNEKNQYVDFIFVGQFYKDIRRPDYLLKLFLNLPDNYRLHIVGRGCDDIVEEYQEQLGDRLINHGWLSREIAEEFRNKADILVNLNNTILNQLPSKLFEYISTGKPILNICKSNKCLSLKYTKKYSNALDVIEGQTIENAANKTIKFAAEKKNQLLDKDIVLENFRENTYEYFAKVVEDNIRGLC